MEVGAPLLNDKDLADTYLKIDNMKAGDIRNIESLTKIQKDCIKFRIAHVKDCELNQAETKVKKIEKWKEVFTKKRY